MAMALVYQPTINALKRPHTSRSTTGSGRTMYHERSRADHRSTGLPKNVAVSDVMPVSMSRQPMLQVSSVLDGQDGNVSILPCSLTSLPQRILLAFPKFPAPLPPATPCQSSMVPHTTLTSCPVPQCGGDTNSPPPCPGSSHRVPLMTRLPPLITMTR